MEYMVSFEFNDMDISKAEMRKELEYMEDYIANKYDADLYRIKINVIE